MRACRRALSRAPTDGSGTPRMYGQDNAMRCLILTSQSSREAGEEGTRRGLDVRRGHLTCSLVPGTWTPYEHLAQPRKGSFDGHKPIDMNERMAPGPGGSEDDWPLSHRLGKDQPQSDTGVGRLLRLEACRSLWVGRVCTQEL